jgi:hypothetical protein
MPDVNSASLESWRRDRDTPNRLVWGKKVLIETCYSYPFKVWIKCKYDTNIIYYVADDEQMREGLKRLSNSLLFAVELYREDE